MKHKLITCYTAKDKGRDVANNLRKTLLEKEMTRKEFLQFIGSAFLVLIGLGNFIAFLKHSKASSSKNANAKVGFGTGRFGS